MSRFLLVPVIALAFLFDSCAFFSPKSANTRVVEKPIIVKCPKVKVPHYKREEIKPNDPPEKVLVKLLNNYRTCELELQQCRKALDVCSP